MKLINELNSSDLVNEELAKYFNFEECFSKFIVAFNKKEIRMKNKKLEKILYKFNFSFNHNKIGNFCQSKIIVIDKIQGNDNKEYYLVCFDYKLIIINRNKDEAYFNEFLSNNIDSKKYFLMNYNEENNNLTQEIFNFSVEFQMENFRYQCFWNKVMKCLSGFLIREGYKNSLKEHKQNKNKKEEFDISNHNYIKIREIYKESSKIDLIYYIPKAAIFSLQKVDDYFQTDLEERYVNINFPFIIRYYGCVEIDNSKYNLFEYIEGISLNKYSKNKLKAEEAVEIIFEVILAIQYLHSKELVYQSINADDIIINEEKDAIITNILGLTKITNMKTNTK